MVAMVLIRIEKMILTLLLIKKILILILHSQRASQLCNKSQSAFQKNVGEKG